MGNMWGVEGHHDKGDSEEETDDEDETAFWAYESRSTDTARLLDGEVG